jgi:hypothetical protein
MAAPLGTGGRLERWQSRRRSPETHAHAIEIANSPLPIGKRLHALRIFAGLTQRDIVRSLSGAQDLASNLERGRRLPTESQADALAELFGIPNSLLKR